MGCWDRRSRVAGPIGGSACRSYPVGMALLCQSKPCDTFRLSADCRCLGCLPCFAFPIVQGEHNCRTFDDFLAALKQSKRKNIRQERKSMAKQNLRIERLRGAQITPDMWNTFHSFYLDTTGTPPALQDHLYASLVCCSLHACKPPFHLSRCGIMGVCDLLTFNRKGSKRGGCM